MPKILCTYCSKEWTEEMLTKYKFYEGSYTPDCVGSRFGEWNDIDDVICGHCKKTVYRIELNNIADKYDNERWN